MPQKWHRMSFKWLRPFFWPTDPTNQNRPTAQQQKFSTSVFSIWFGWNLVWGLIMGQKQHRMSLMCLRPFFDLPSQPTEIDQKWKFQNGLTWSIFIPSDSNLVWKSFISLKVENTLLRWLQAFFDLPAQPTKINKLAKIINFCVFHPIWMKFGMGANNGPKIT